LIFSPLPVALETPSGMVIVSLEMFDEITGNYCKVKSFAVSELSQTMVNIQKLPDASYSFARVQKAAQWRLSLPGDPPGVDLAFQAACLTPFALCGACRVDSYYTPEMIPTITASLTVGEISVEYRDTFNQSLCYFGIENISTIGEFWPNQKIYNIEAETEIFANVLNKKTYYLETVIQELRPKLTLLEDISLIGKKEYSEISLDVNFSAPELGMVENFCF